MATHVLIIALATGASLAILLLAVGLAQLAMAAQQDPSPGRAWGLRATLDGPEAKAPPSL